MLWKTSFFRIYLRHIKRFKDPEFERKFASLGLPLLLAGRFASLGLPLLLAGRFASLGLPPSLAGRFARKGLPPSLPCIV